MRFAFCIFKYFPYGGIQRDLMKMLRECQARGHEVKIFTLRWEAPPLDDVEVECLPIVGLNRHSQYDHFAEAVRVAVAAEHFDLVVGFNKMPGLDVYYAGDSCYLEKALNQRSAWYRLLPRFKSFQAAEAAVFDSHADTEILTISDVEVPRYRHHYQTQPERLHSLPPGIERDRVAPDDVGAARRALRAAHDLDEDTLVVLFVGSGFIKKGLDRALLAVAALPEPLRERVHMFVIGRDKGEPFRRMAMRLGILSRITFYTEGRDDVPDFLFGADALLHPAYDENAGMVIIEAMLAGLPAVVTRNCGYARYLAEQDAGIVLPTPFTQSSLDEALEEILTSEKRASWQANGRALKNREEVFNLVPTAVDHLEAFAAKKQPLLVFTLFRYFPYGGQQRDFMRIALACQAAGYRIVVYTLAWEGSVPEGFDVIIVPVGAVANHKRYAEFAEAVAELAKWRHPAAIIGFNKMPGLDIYYAADSCYEHKVQEMRSPVYRRLERYRLLSRFERAVFEADAGTRIMLIAQSQAEQFQRYYNTPAERYTMLPPGVSQDRARGPNWQEERAAVRAELGLGDDEFLLLLVGSGFITKGLDRALTALASLPPELAERTRFLVIGQDTPTQFLRLAKSLGVEEQLILQRGRDDIPAVLQGADLMVHPAYMESGGMVLIEAIIAGLPVIATAVCGFAHYIEDARAGVVVPEPFVQETLNAAVAETLMNDAQRADWSRAGVAFGEAHTELYDMPAHALAFIEASIDANPRSASARRAQR